MSDTIVNRMNIRKHICSAILIAFILVSGTHSGDMDIFKIGMDYLKQGKLDSAQAILNQARIQYPKNIEIMIALGKVYQQKAERHKNGNHITPALEEYKKDIGIYRNMIRHDSNNIIALNNLGLIYYNLNNFELAESMFHKALGVDSNNFKTLMNMGNAQYWIHENRSRAKEYWYRALHQKEIDSINAGITWKNIGIVYYNESKLDSAETSFKRSLGFDPESADTRVWLGRIAAVRENFDNAIKCYRDALALDSNCVEAICAWSESLYIIKDRTDFTFRDKTKELRDIINSNLSRDSLNSPKYHLYLGYLYLAENKYDLVSFEFDKAKFLDSSLIIPEM